MDDFKKYMQHHTGELDFDEPGEAVWKNIAGKAKSKQGSSVMMLLRFAAAACFILIATLAVLFVNHSKKDVVQNAARQTNVTTPLQKPLQKPVPIQQKQEAPLAEQSLKKQQAKVGSVRNRVKGSEPLVYYQKQQNAPLLQNIENSFSQLVSMQLNKVRSLPLYAEGPEYYSEFKRQFQQLEEDEKEVKKQIGKQGLINENLDQLISVYQQKLNLLKMLQNEINKTNNQYKQNNRSDSTSKINYINI